MPASACTETSCFLTGASSGIGAALARHYAATGATLGLAARRQHRLFALAAELPGTHRCYALDVADAATVQVAAADFMARHGCPDIVIANAGVSAGTLVAEAGDLPAFRRIFETNVIGMAQTLQPLIAAMKARGSGRRAGIASVAGIRGLPGAGAYSASKAASIAWLEALRVELHGSGVKVVTIAPGTSYSVIPWQMGVVAKLMRLLPKPVFDTLFARAGRKPRGLDL